MDTQNDTAMQKLIVFTLAFISITSCSKDSFDQELLAVTGPEKSEIMVRVSYLEWNDDQCETGCFGPGNDVIVYIEGANVKVYEGSGSDDINSSIIDVHTDRRGAALIENIEPSQYTIVVETAMGDRSRTITTQLKKRSYIDFSF